MSSDETNNRVGSQKGHESATEPWLNNEPLHASYSFNKNTLPCSNIRQNGDPQAAHRLAHWWMHDFLSWVSSMQFLQRSLLGSKLFPDTRLWVCRIRGAGINNPFYQGHSQHYPNALLWGPGKEIWNSPFSETFWGPYQLLELTSSSWKAPRFRSVEMHEAWFEANIA